MNVRKLSFRAIVSLVVGSQIGTGAFLLPSSLAGIGSISLVGWLISTAGAILLSLVFAELSLLTSKGGGPYVYVEKAFGRRIGFYVAWVYWLISWVSSIAVILAAISYLSNLLGFSHPTFLLILEILLVSGVTLLNVRGARLVGSMEFYLTILKCAPLVIIPILALFYFMPENLQPLYHENSTLLSSLNTSTMMTFWGFVGIEMANVASGIIENPKKTVPRAVITGTIIVSCVYIVSSFGIMGILPSQSLAQTSAPFAEASKIIFGHGWDALIALIAFLACVGTLNAWVLAGGQVAVEAAKDQLFPSIFARTNKFGAPYMSLLISLVVTIILLIAGMSPSILSQLNAIIDISVITFVLIYLLCMLSYIKISLTERKITPYFVLALLASGFCIWILAFMSLSNLLWCSLFFLTGMPVYFWNKRKARRLAQS